MNEYLNKKPKMLFHVCCATCALYPISFLKKDYEITILFYNPNIYPREEYEKRLSEAKMISKIYSLPFIQGRYETKKWFNYTENLKNEPEGGNRCNNCFYLRLHETAMLAIKRAFDIFATTLTVSPHKNHIAINSIGAEISRKLQIDFLESNFKKKDGFKKTMELSKKLNIYRQNYCGCIYSKKKI